MVAFNEIGQGYFTFEELDFDGALQDVLKRVRVIQDFLDVWYKNEIVSSDVIRQSEKNVDKYLKVALYLERLKRGQNYA
jgi:hypothetical protein